MNQEKAQRSQQAILPAQSTDVNEEDARALTNVPAVNEQHDADVIIVGAGFAGMYALHLLRSRGFRVAVLEAASEVGGTWYWNRYPGARCDAQSLVYCYLFDRDLHDSWNWSERYATQGEILAYLKHVADRLDLRRDIRFNARVASAYFDEMDSSWRITCEDGTSLRGRWLIMASGALSVPRLPPIAGIENFEGKYYHTSDWPETGASFAGHQVGIIGTGSSGVQAIPLIAAKARHLTVFQRTANFVLPARNAPATPEQTVAFQASFEDYRRDMRRGELKGIGDIIVGAHLPPPARASDLSRAEQVARLDAYWAVGGVNIAQAFADSMTNDDANAIIADYCRDKIREIVENPEVAEVLVPKGYPIGARRICVGTDYYETYNRPNVTLVDLIRTPIAEITPKGVRTADADYEFDILVYATGFDAITGALLAIDIRGREGRSLRDCWRDGPKTYLGVAVAGFPNLFTITGPGSPSALSTVTVSIEQHVEWVSDLLDYARREDIETIEATPEAQEEWTRHVAKAAEGTIFSKGQSWYQGANIPGKPRVFLAYARGVGPYRDICDDVAAKSYPGFDLNRGEQAGRPLHADSAQ